MLIFASFTGITEGYEIENSNKTKQDVDVEIGSESNYEERKQRAYLNFSSLLGASHYDSINSLGKDGHFTLIKSIEESEFQSEFEFQKLLGKAYRMLLLDKSINDESMKAEFDKQFKSIYKQLWINYPYDREVAQYMLLGVLEEEEHEAFLINVLKKDPENPSFLRHLSIIYKLDGLTHKSIYWLEKAINAQPISEWRRGYVYELLGLMKDPIDFKEIEEKFGVKIDPNKI